jgi:hypothetical protein
VSSRTYVTAPIVDPIYLKLECCTNIKVSSHWQILLQNCRGNNQGCFVLNI